MSLVATYLKLTKEYSDKYGDKTVVLMMVGSFYEIYGEKLTNRDGSFSVTGSKIEEKSKLCDLSIAQKIAGASGTHVMAGFTYTKIDKYLKKILFLKLSEMTADLAEEHSTATLATERLEAEQSERMRLEKEKGDLEVIST